MRRVLVLAAALLASLLSPACSQPKRSVILLSVAGARGTDIAGLTRSVGALSPTPDSPGAAASLMTGTLPGGAGWAGEGDLARVPPGVATLAEALRKAGFETRAYVGEGSISSLSGLGRGFDFFLTPSSPTLTAIAADESARLRPWRGGFVSAKDVASEFLQYLRARPNQNPLFVWIHLADPVGRFDPIDPKGAYESAMKDVNEAIALVRDALDSYGLAGRTTLIVAPLYGIGLGEGGEQRFGLTLSDPVVEQSIHLAGADAEAFDAPRSLAGLHDALLDLLGVPAAQAPRTNPAPAAASTTLPARLYGWPALLRSEGEPAPLLAARPGDAPPPQVLAKMGEAHVALAREDTSSAISALREAAALAPLAIAPRALLVELLPPQERTALLAELRPLAGASPARRIDVARTLAGADDTAGSRAILEPLAGEPLRPGERVALAEQLSSIGATDLAIEQVQQLINEEKDAPEFHEWLGDLLQQTGNAYRARIAYEKALESPRARSANLVAKLGNALVELGEKDAALVRYGEALKIDPGYRYPYTRAAELLLAQGKEGEAATALVQSVGKSGDPTQDVLNQARALERADLLSYAAQLVSEALEQDPRNLALQLGMARLLGAGGKHDDARQRLQAILTAHPEVAQAWVELARVEAAAGNETAAIAALDRAEPIGGPQITATVRADQAFLKFGAGSALAQRARGFEGRGQPKAQPPTERTAGVAGGGA